MGIGGGWGRRGVWGGEEKGENALVEDMHDTIRNDDIGDDDLSSVDEDLAVFDQQLHFASLHGRDGVVGEALLDQWGVGDGAVDDVVCED